MSEVQEYRGPESPRQIAYEVAEELYQLAGYDPALLFRNPHDWELRTDEHGSDYWCAGCGVYESKNTRASCPGFIMETSIRADGEPVKPDPFDNIR